MKTILIFSALALLALAGCSSEEPATDPNAADVADQAAAEEAPAAAPVEQASDHDSRPEVVEESGGEPEEPEDKPIVLAQADAGGPAREWKFKEGQQFHRLVPTQPTIGGADKVEVAEFFWYGCVHCYEFEPYIGEWDESKPANARLVRIPATWNPLVQLHAQLYYTEETLVENGKIADPAAFRAAIFNEYHRRGNRMTSQDSIRSVFERLGVSGDDFDATWSSFGVAQKLRRAQDLSRRYAITGVPAMVVNGKYRLGKADTGSYPTLLEAVDELIERETLR